MIPSVAELQANLMKAARGLGLPLGIAEDIAGAAPFVLAADDPNETLAQLLGQMGNGQIVDIVTAIDQALNEGSAEVEGTLAAHVLVASAGYKAQHLLVMKNGWIDAQGTMMITRAHPSRKVIDDGLWSTLEGFAARTYVPATEASRLKGAGAGLTDND